MAELVDALDLGSSGAIRGGSSPPFGMTQRSPRTEIDMKRKNEIPDFSKKKVKGPQQPHGVPDVTKVQQPPPAPPVRSGKPPATSMKSGRRGS